MKLVSVEIRGKYKRWSINCYASNEEIETMREDGLEVDEIVNSVPLWAYNLHISRLYIFLQDVWNFRFLK